LALLAVVDPAVTSNPTWKILGLEEILPFAITALRHLRDSGHSGKRASMNVNSSGLGNVRFIPGR
jgi:hypothetical protein